MKILYLEIENYGNLRNLTGRETRGFPRRLAGILRAERSGQNHAVFVYPRDVLRTEIAAGKRRFFRRSRALLSVFRRQIRRLGNVYARGKNVPHRAFFR